MEPGPLTADDKAAAVHGGSNLCESALTIDGVSHSYGARRALDNVSFTVAPASFTALLGLNGAGKSTLFSLITRLFGVQTGRIGIFGYDIGRDPGDGPPAECCPAAEPGTGSTVLGAGITTGPAWGSRHRTIAITPNEAALSTNAAVSPPTAIRTPAIAGPTTKARLSRLDQALLAGPSSVSSLTRLGRYDPIVGAKNVEKQVARIARPRNTIAHPGPGYGIATIPAVSTASPTTPTTTR